MLTASPSLAIAQLTSNGASVSITPTACKMTFFLVMVTGRSCLARLLFGAFHVRVALVQTTESAAYTLIKEQCNKLSLTMDHE